MQELRPLSPCFDPFPPISGTQPLRIMLVAHPGSSPSVCLGCFAVLTFKKVVCSNFGELSNAQYSLHGVWCMMFNMNFEGQGLSFFPSPNGNEQQGPQSPSGLGENISLFQELLVTGSPFLPLCFLLGRSSKLFTLPPKKLFSNLQALKAGRFGKRHSATADWEPAMCIAVLGVILSLQHINS